MRTVQLYQVKRDGLRFWALVRSSEHVRRFTLLKKQETTEGDSLLDAAVRLAGHWAKQRAFQAVTVPPCSGVGLDWAAAVAKRIATAADCDFVTAFKPHGLGRRYGLPSRFEPLAFERTDTRLEGLRVLLFDDFCLTGRTMVGALRALAGLDIQGLVLGAG